ncbi:hypothetical protein HanRHA438_Chr12g0538091 [Helianthus annuus]|nr:hypothetical protein HanIR_Chr12g0567581 [Helianthus annuus]KAJ0865211.1 hypothetical protein HanRHA438_Chr12g0538091 [Helianthus annuus]
MWVSNSNLLLLWECEVVVGVHFGISFEIGFNLGLGVFRLSTRSSDQLVAVVRRQVLVSGREYVDRESVERKRRDRVERGEMIRWVLLLRVNYKVCPLCLDQIAGVVLCL